MNIPLKISVGRFPLNFTETPLNIFKALIRRIRAYISSDSVITGATSGLAPKFNLGPWFYELGSSDSHWWVWKDGAYIPDVKQITNGTFTTTLGRLIPGDEAHPAVEVLFPPDQGGTLVSLVEVYVPRDVSIISGTDINWNTSSDFTQRLTANTTFTFSNLINGRKITVAIENNGTAHTVTWPATVKWPAGTPPTQPNAAAGQNAVAVYYFYRINSVTYGEKRLSSFNTPQAYIPVGGPDSVPGSYGAPENFRGLSKLPF